MQIINYCKWKCSSLVCKFRYIYRNMQKTVANWSYKRFLFYCCWKLSLLSLFQQLVELLLTTIPKTFRFVWKTNRNSKKNEIKTKKQKVKSRRNVQQFETRQAKTRFFVCKSICSVGIVSFVRLSTAFTMSKPVMFVEFASMKPQLFCDIQYSVESIHVACLLRHSAV